MARKKRPASAMRRVHRTVGVFAAIFVIFMVFSGLVINHSNGLGLDRRQVSGAFLPRWYGIGEPEKINSFVAGDKRLSFAGSQLYLNDQSVATISGGVGAVFNGELLIAAGSDELLLLDPDGALVERLPWGSISEAPIESLGLDENGVVLVKSANQLWLADAELLNWRRAGDDISTPHWSFPEPIPVTLQQAITRQYRGDGLSLERVLLDLHSGRIFGPIGIVVYDLLALALGFLAISGLVIWMRSKSTGKRK